MNLPITNYDFIQIAEKTCSEVYQKASEKGLTPSELKTLDFTLQARFKYQLALFLQQSLNPDDNQAT